jgi:hypothetical protein
VHGLQPRVAVQQNGTRKGATLQTNRTLYSSPGFEDVWQLHWSYNVGTEFNPAGIFIATSTSPWDCRGADRAWWRTRRASGPAAGWGMRPLAPGALPRPARRARVLRHPESALQASGSASAGRLGRRGNQARHRPGTPGGRQGGRGGSTGHTGPAF